MRLSVRALGMTTVWLAAWSAACATGGDTVPGRDGGTDVRRDGTTTDTGRPTDGPRTDGPADIVGDRGMTGMDVLPGRDIVTPGSDVVFPGMDIVTPPPDVPTVRMCVSTCSDHTQCQSSCPLLTTGTWCCQSSTCVFDSNPVCGVTPPPDVVVPGTDATIGTDGGAG